MTTSASINVSETTIANGYRALTRTDATARWRWARMVASFIAAAPDAKRAEAKRALGAAIAQAVSRETPYSIKWVEAYVRAIGLHPTEPANDAERCAFLEALNNHGSRAKGAKESTVEDALRMLKSAAKMAHNRGADDATIEAALQEALAAIGAGV